jgi:hypothetical protein
MSVSAGNMPSQSLAQFLSNIPVSMLPSQILKVA